MGTALQLASWGFWGRSLSLVRGVRSFHCGICSWISVKEPPEPKVVDRWTEKRALFGVYDNIGILGDFHNHPKDLIRGPKWLRGWRGNELQRCIRKKRMVGDRMFDQDYHNLTKRIRFLYKRFNRTGKHR